MLNRIRQLFSPARPASGDSPKDKAIACKTRGNELLLAGQEDDAIACYLEAVSIAPDYAEGWNNLGYVYLRQGREEEAEHHLTRAIALNPGLANAHYNLGILFRKAGRLEDAVTNLLRAVENDPENFAAHHELGLTFQELGRLDDARESFGHAASLNAEFLPAHFSLGKILLGLGQTSEAIACLNRVIALDPDFFEAYFELAEIYRQLGQFDVAVPYYEKTIALQPGHYHAHNNLGAVFLKLDRLEQASACFRTAAAIQPDHISAHVSLSTALNRLGILDEALACADRAVALSPADALAHVARGVALTGQDRLMEAEACFRHALALDPKRDATRVVLATGLLSRGNLAEGWGLYGYRFFAGSTASKRSFDHKEWSGEDMRDKAIVVWRDQGIGDEILFASLLPDIIARARRCVVECANKLVPLFTLSFPDAVVVPKMEPPHPATRDDIDFQIALADAARWLRPDIASFPTHDRYLTADAARVAHWKAKLAALGTGLKIGFAWRSSLVYGQRSLHYTTLDQWEPIFSVPGVHFINLQYGECAEELAAARERFGIPLHAFAEVDLFDDLAEAAALNLALDLVISAPTATAFLSAALGVPTWMMSYGTPWQLLGTDHMPWFPAMQCFPRKWNQPWEQVIGAIAQALASRCREPGVLDA